MKIYVELDCIKLNNFEQLILSTIKGVLYDYNHHKTDTDKFYYTTEYKIIVKPVNDRVEMTSFVVIPLNGSIPSTPVGLFNDIKKLIEPVSFGFLMHGGFQTDGSTNFLIQRFSVSYETFHGWVSKPILK